MSKWILDDLLKECDSLRSDWESQRIWRWFNRRTPGTQRGRRIDLLVGPFSSDETNLEDRSPTSDFRIAIEHKSVITAHRNRDARFDDLNDDHAEIHSVRPNAVLVATILVGVCDDVLNVPDKIKDRYKGRLADFESGVLPRLSTGDQSLWAGFAYAISHNAPNDPLRTVEKFRNLPRRPVGNPRLPGYDYIALIPVRVDNVNPPQIARENDLGIDVDAIYREMLDTICAGYRTRWHT